ncbi:hypothetical protein HS041_12260 [Planomonospora sp. ID67723]|uniref:hypothetical protein n=1 Tax=Planomonospora sp. ID67723 TaxID=2738134 RepID=UPI0018C3E5AC|nr:hypothetical protein [Planomonospora sp. ID67723]MBG0828542.1 hypothetical protein [Planomonospora sp. ID67723]
MAAIVNVDVPQGADTYRIWQITASDTAVNLTTADVTAVIKPSPHVADNAASAVALSEGDGITITSASEGKVRIDIPTTITESPGAWYYKIILEMSGDTEPAIHGWITITDT